MNRLSTERRALILGCLVEGMSIRATTRLNGAAKNTVAKLLMDVGDAASAYLGETMRDLPCQRIECDEIWSFVYAKAKNVPDEHQGEWGYGDVWTWVGIDADTKLVPSFMLGGRSTEDATRFMKDLAGRLRNRVQLTTDGHSPYLTAVGRAFGSEIDYACFRKSMALRKRPKSVTAQPSASVPRVAGSRATPTPIWSRPATSNGRTSRCGWGCAV